MAKVLEGKVAVVTEPVAGSAGAKRWRRRRRAPRWS